MTRLRVHIGRVTGCRHPLDSDELSHRVAAELGELLAREPLPRMPAPGAVIEVPGGRVHTGSAATSASLAYSIARHVHTTLYTATPCR
jgi:hypothetical protein